MKFGETLRQRSVPQWSAYNVDYDELKQLIKENTLGKDTTDPVPIPGQNGPDSSDGQFEEQLFPILCQQHQRVNLFTKSKYGEFERRMDHLGRQARALNQRPRIAAARPLQNTKKFERLAKEVDSVSEDIQALSRFVAIQKQAFRKILKKYRKWTGSSGLELRMNNEAFNQPESVLNLDFTPLLDRLESVISQLNALLQPEDDGSGQRPYHPRKPSDNTHGKPRSIASRLHDEFLHATSLGFDAAFSSVPLGRAGGRATYWVHKDNLDEVIVLLRRYMGHRKDSSSPPTSSRRSSTSIPGQRLERTGSVSAKEHIHFSMFDNLQRFLKAYGALTVGQTEAQVGSVSSMLAMSILWGTEADAMVLTSDLSPSTPPTQRQVDTSRMRCKDLEKIFAIEGQSPRRRQAPLNDDIQLHREWLAQNRDVKPLAEVQCSRFRFAGLNNTNEVGTWALLDMGIKIGRVNEKKIGSRDQSLAGKDLDPFPHAVLEVRWEFSRMPEVVRALDSTHLVERVRGFSLEAQAICTVCRSQDVPVPMWQPLLDRDIRKVPSLQARATFRKTPMTLGAGPSGPSSSEGPASILSANPAQSSATSLEEPSQHTQLSSALAAKPKSPPAKQVVRKKPSRRKSQSQVRRYWNEFDDGDEAEDQTYAIYVTPDEETPFPGVEAMSRALTALRQGFDRTKRAVKSCLPLRGRETDFDEAVRRPLLRGNIDGQDDNDDDDTSDSDTSIPPARRSRKYRSIARAETPGPINPPPLLPRPSIARIHKRRSREKIIFRTYLGCYAISYIFLIIAAILHATGKHKALIEVDVGVIVGVIAALASALTGGSLLMSREEKLSWLHRSLGLGGFLVVCAGSGWLLASIGKTL